jgi:hypothetical protein
VEAAVCAMSEPIDYESIIALSEQTGRPTATLLALAPQHDPFFAGRLGRRQWAEWFGDLWKRLKFGPGTHLRRIHYVLVSQTASIVCPDDIAYTNTAECWARLLIASRDARYLALVPVEDFDDRRNEGVHEHLSDSWRAASLSVEEVSPLSADLSLRLWRSMGDPPGFIFDPPVIDQRYHVELWAEKTTMNDVLFDLAWQYNLNVVTASGEISLTHCYRLIERAKASGRPVRILYLSDFDPAGQSMPVACARKIEFLLRRDNLDLDIEVRPIVLTHEQCLHYRLPRTPIKESDRRGASFEDRFGEGATELDALEALRPGQLRRLLQAELRRYYDARLDKRVGEEADRFRNELEATRAEVLRDHAKQLAAIRKDYGQIVDSINAEFDAVTKQYRMRFKRIVGRYNRLQAEIVEELRVEAPDPELVDWPEPDEGNEDDDPLFDSTRDYIEQIDRFKRHQGKRTARKARNEGKEE